MKNNKFLKNVGMMIVVLTIGVFTAGCASTQQEQPNSQGSSAAEKEIARAEAARQKAISVGGEWRDISKILKKAKKALKAGDEAKALKLATKARRQAEIGYAQALREQSAKQSSGGTAGAYTVSKGDSLWSISGESAIYADPYKWPLIYKANRDQIKDADLIFPGQSLDIDRGASSADINAAISHARGRGAWAVGTTEDSDKAYLAR